MHPRVVKVRSNVKADIYIGRTRAGQSKWGNPFKLKRHGVATFRRYLDYLRDRPELVADAKTELKGLVLACWCAPGPCHGDVLARLADGEELTDIRDDVLGRLGGGQQDLFEVQHDH